MKKWLTVFMILSLMAPNTVFAEEIQKPKADAQGAVLMDFETGRVLWGKNEKEPMAMASTTKIMTCILALESGRLDETVTATKNAAIAPKTRMGLQTGEEHRLGDLLYPLMLMSANDSAVAIAEHLGGSVEGFCEMMNEKAKEIGCEDTVFETPNGLDKGEHHSTAYDMALITRYAMSNEKFVEIINTKSISIPTQAGSDEKRYDLVNKNRLLNEYEGAMGVKTGFTGKAGQCFVGAAQRDGRILISVVLASGWGTKGKEQKWRDTRSILDYGFANYQYDEILNGGEKVRELPVTFSREGSVSLCYEDSLRAMLRSDERNSLRYEISLPDTLEAPVEKGQSVGEVKIYTDGGELVGQSKIIAEENVLRHDFKTSLKKIIDGWLRMGGSSVFE